jgi:hypothetical protein
MLQESLAVYPHTPHFSSPGSNVRQDKIRATDAWRPLASVKPLTFGRVWPILRREDPERRNAGSKLAQH